MNRGLLNIIYNKETNGVTTIPILAEIHNDNELRIYFPNIGDYRTWNLVVNDIAYKIDTFDNLACPPVKYNALVYHEYAPITINDIRDLEIDLHPEVNGVPSNDVSTGSVILYKPLSQFTPTITVVQDDIEISMFKDIDGVLDKYGITGPGQLFYMVHAVHLDSIQQQVFSEYINLDIDNDKYDLFLHPNLLNKFIMPISTSFSTLTSRSEISVVASLIKSSNDTTSEIIACNFGNVIVDGTSIYPDNLQEVMDIINTDIPINIYSKNVINNITNRIDNTNPSIIKPTFYRVSPLSDLTIHVGVKENICLNLDLYKSSVYIFKLKIGDNIYTEINRNHHGVMFAVDSRNSIPTAGTYHILGDEDELVSSGKYSIVL